MATTPKAQKQKLGGKIIGQTAKYLGNGAIDYLKSTMPTSSSILNDAKSTVTEVTNKFKSTAQSIAPTVKNLKGQGGLRKVMSWYLQEEDGFGDGFDGSDLNFDIPTDDSSAEIAVEQISETVQSANQISSSVVASSKQMLEGQTQLTANLLSALDSQTAVITTGFNTLNESLSKITEIVTANQEALIKTTAATAAAVSEGSGSSKDSGGDMLSRGKFSLNEYKKMIGQNIKNDPLLGSLSALTPFLQGDTLKMLLTPETLISGAMNFGIDKLFPDMKKTLGSLDKMVNDEIMNFLINLGDNAGDYFGEKGMLGRLFGLKSDRNVKAGTGRQKFDVKATPFDTVTREAIITTIPGYLQKILESLTGENVTYDMRTRSFRTKEDQMEEYKDAMLRQGNIHNASKNLQSIFGADQYGQSFYDLMIADLAGRSASNGSDNRQSDRRSTIESFKNQEDFEKYATALLSKAGVDIEERQNEWITETAKMFSGANARTNIRDLTTQVAKVNVDRNRASEEYMKNAQLYNVDMSGAELTPDEEVKRLAKKSGFQMKSGDQEISSVQLAVSSDLTGVNYTNKALYEIFRLMHRGLNVFQVGSSNNQKDKFDDKQNDLDKRLKPPGRYKPTMAGTGAAAGAGSNALMPEIMKRSSEEDPNLLLDYERDEDGNVIMEDDPDNPGQKRPKKKSGSQRLAGWGKRTGQELKDAIFSGDPSKIISALGHSLRDVRELGEDALKTGAKKVNKKFGNVTGYLQHKLTGKGYQYEDENGNLVTVADTKIATGKKDKDGNEIMKSGGLLGFARDYMGKMFEPLKDKGKNWFQKVMKDFDLGDKDDKGGIKSKRKKFLMSSVGAMAGAGLLGGPLGLLMGAIAGNAIGAADVGGRIKQMLFGSKDKGDKKDGLFTKLGNHIINPIRFQFQKTAHWLGDKLRKNILGPLSDIGYAIKERITSAAKSRFGKVFKKIGEALLAPFKGIAKIIMAPFNLIFKKIPNMLGTAARATITGVTGATGFGMNRVADIIAGGKKRQKLDANGNRLYKNKETGEEIGISDEDWSKMNRRQRRQYESIDVNIHEGLKARREARKRDIEDETKNSVFRKGGGKKAYNEWLQQDRERRAEAKKDFAAYTQEQIVQTSEDTNAEVKDIADDTGNILEQAQQQSQEIDTHIEELVQANQEQNAELIEAIETSEEEAKSREEQLLENTKGLESLIQAGLEEGSIYTHDKGVHEYLETIIDLMGGEDAPASRSTQEIEGIEPVEESNPELDAIEAKLNAAMDAGDYDAVAKYDEQWQFASRNAKYGMTPLDDSFGSPDLFDDEDESSQEIEGLAETFTENAEKDRENALKGSMLSGMQASAMQGDYSDRENTVNTKAINDATDENKSTQVLARDLKEMNRMQIEDHDKAEEKQETIWDKIFGALGNIWTSLGGSGGLLQLLGGAALIGGIIALIKGAFGDVDFSKILGSISNVVDAIGTKIGAVWNALTGNSGQDPTTTGINLATGTVFDAVSDNPVASILPGGDYVHIKKGANGEDIINQNASNLKDDALYINPFKQEIIKVTSAADSVNRYAALTEYHGNRVNTIGSEMSDIQKQIIAKGMDMDDIAAKYTAAINAEDWEAAARYQDEWQFAIDNASPEDLKKLEKKYGKLSKKQDKEIAKTEKYGEKAQNAAEKESQAIEQLKTGTGERIFKAAGNLGLIYGEGALAGEAGKLISGALGFDEQGQETIGNLTNTLTSAGISSYEMRSAITGKQTINNKIVNKGWDLVKEAGSAMKSDATAIGEKIAGSSLGKTVGDWVTHGKDAIKKLFDGLLKKIKDSPIFKKVAGAISEKFGAISSKISKLFENPKFLTKFSAQCEEKAAAGGAKAAAGSIPILTILAVGVFGLLGWADGIVGAAHLFAVRTVDVDDDMRTISSSLKAFLGAISGFSVGSFITIALEAICVAMNAFGCDSLLTMLATAIYNGLQGSDRPMEVKQERFQKQIDRYEEETGVKLNKYEFNDKVNNADLLSWIWEGETSYDEDFNYEFDESGLDFKKDGGIAGGNKQYYRDDKGQILKTADGQAVQLMDAKGHKIKYDYKWGDALADMIGDMGRGIVGGAVYATNDDGTAKIDPRTGQAIVEKYENGFFGGIADFFSGGAVTKANEELARNAKLAAKNGFMPTDEDEANWIPQPDWPTAYELNQTLPKAQQEMSLTDLYQSGFEIDFNGERISAAKAIAFASMNTRKCIQAGLWHEDDTGTIIKSAVGSQVVDYDPEAAEHMGGMSEDYTGEIGNPMDYLEFDDKGNATLFGTPVAFDEDGTSYFHDSNTNSWQQFDINQAIAQYQGVGTGVMADTAESHIGGDINPEAEAVTNPSFFDHLKKTIDGYLGGIGDFFNDVGEKFMSGVHQIGDFFVGVKDGVVGFFKGIGDGIGNFFNGIENFGSMIANEQAKGQAIMDDPDSHLSNMFQIEDDPQNPMNGFSKVVAVISRLSVIPPAIFKKIGKTIAQFVDNLTKPIRNSFSTLSSNIPQLHALSSQGDVEGVLGMEMEEDPENPVGGITKAIFGVSKFINVGIAGIHWVGGKIKEKFDQAVQRVSSDFSLLATNQQALHDASQTGDFSQLQSIEFQTDENNPAGGLLNGIFQVSKIIHYVPTAIHWVGNKISEGFQAVVAGTVDTVQQLGPNHEALDEASASGDLQALGALEFQGNEESPVYGLAKGIFAVDKILHYPGAAISWVGHKIGEAFTAVGKGVADTFTMMGDEHAALDEASSKGDFEALGAVEFEGDESSPVYGLAKGLFFVDKILHYPGTAIHWVGGKIFDFFSAMGSKIANNKAKLDTATQQLSEYADKGDIGAIWNSGLDLEEGDPLFGIWHGAFIIGKLFNTAVGAFKIIGNWIGGAIDGVNNFFGGIVDGIGDFVSGIGEGIGDFFSGIGDAIFQWAKGGGEDGADKEDVHPAEHIGGPNPVMKAASTAMKSKPRIPIGGEEIGSGAPSNIRKDENGKVYQTDTSGTAELKETNAREPGGNPTDKDVTVSLGYGGLWGDVYTPSKPHGGIDMYPSDGTNQANIVSRWDGVVTYAVSNRTASGMNIDPSLSTGNNVSILTTNPATGQEMTVRHMHMKPNTVPSNITNAAAAYNRYKQTGDPADLEAARVNVGDKIGEMGTTGMSSGVHLHYQMNKGNVPTAGQRDASVMDPTPFFSTVKDSSGINYGLAATGSSGSQGLADAASDQENSEDKGILGNLIDKITEFGNEFLFMITGGLLGSKEEKSSGSGSIGDGSYTSGGSSSGYSGKKATADRFLDVVRKEVGFVDPDNGINKYNNWFYGGLTEDRIAAASDIRIKDVLEMLSEGERQAYNYSGQGIKVLTAEHQKLMQKAIENEKKADTLTKTYQGDTLMKDLKRYKNWNVAFIMWAFNQIGCKIGADTDLPEKFLEYVRSNAKKYDWSVVDCGIIKEDDSTIEPGDILAIKAYLRGISGGAPSNIQKDINGNTIDTSKTTVDTYTLAVVDSKVDNMPGFYNVIIPCCRDSAGGKAKVISVQYRPAGKSGTYVMKLCQSLQRSDISSQVVEKGDVEPVWASLKALGYTDEQAAGILGNIQRENGVRSRAMEMDHAKSFDPALYDKVTTDRAATDDWVKRFVREYQQTMSPTYNLDDWKADDGHYYPGLGFVGFTGPNTKNYFDWLQSEAPGHTWDEGGAQLAYMDEMIRTKPYYAGLRSKMTDPSRGPAEQARAFFSRYEFLNGSEDAEYANMAAKYAVPIYNDFKGSYPDVPERRLLSDEEAAYANDNNDHATGGGVSKAYNHMHVGGGKESGGEIQIPDYVGQVQEAITSEPKGGDSTIVSGNYTPAKPKIGGSDSESGTVTTTIPTVTPDTPRATPYTVSNTSTTESNNGTDLTEVLKMMGMLGQYLYAIAGNTAESNDQLATLNSKDFGVDKDLRATLSAASKVQTHKTLSKGANTNSMKGIMNLAKP